MYLASLFSADTTPVDSASLSRLEPLLLSDQALMEIVVEGLTDKFKGRFQDANGEYKDVSAWKELKCDEDGNVTEVKFSFVEGTLYLDFVPPHVRNLLISSEDLHGTLDTARLPQDLEVLNINYSCMSGSVDFTQLPPRLVDVCFMSCQFSGDCDLTALPPGLVKLFISNIPFSGTVDVIKLPQTLKDLRVFGTKISGDITLSTLPAGLESMWLHNNNLTGLVRILQVPQSLAIIRLDRNAFYGVATVSSKIQNDAKSPDLYLFGNTLDSVVDESGHPHRAMGKFMHEDEELRTEEMTDMVARRFFL